MKKFLSIRKHLITISLPLFLLILFFSATQANAATSDNVSGWAWSSNIGWVKLNNCSPTCTGPNFGVTFQPSGAGTASGYAYSSNIGWISFNASAVTGCPTGFSQCTAFADWANPSDGIVYIKGWARACSVFASGCSGSLKPDTARGGWDGWIALGKTSNAPAGVNWGWRITDNNSVAGYAWGGDIIGWLRITDAVIAPSVPTASLDASPSSILAGQSSTLTWSSINTTSCSGNGFNTSGATSGSVSVSPPVTTMYTVTCVGPGGSAQADATVTVTGAAAVTATLVANPTRITSGGSSTLTWTSTNATSCSGTNFDPAGATGGSLPVSPTATTLYTVLCTGPGGSAQASATVTVGKLPKYKEF